MKLSIIQGDITKQETDIIVNSANKSLNRGSGVCGAIHKTAGIELEKECMQIKKEKQIDFFQAGDVVVTKAYNLPCKYVFHAIAPRKSINENETLTKCYYNSLIEAEQIGAKSITFPAISTNIYGFTLEESAKSVVEALKKMKEYKHLQEIRLIFRVEEQVKEYKKLIEAQIKK